MSGGNSGSFFNPKNLIPAVLTGGISYGVTELQKNMKPQIPKAPTTPTLTPPPTPTDSNPDLTAQQRAKKLAALQMGMASTITNSTFGNAQTATPGLKAKLGQ